MGVSMEELQLAARNHGLPLEVLRYPVTPAGLHYLLIHYDIPAIDPAAWRLAVGGLVERPLPLSLDDLPGMEHVPAAATIGCAANWRALLDPPPPTPPCLA